MAFHTDLRVQTRRLAGYTVAAIHGELDLATAAILRERLFEIIDSSGAAIILDLSQLSFCDARGLAALMAVERRARHSGGTVYLATPQPLVAKVLRLTGLDQHFAVYPTPEAVAALDQRLPDTLGQRLPDAQEGQPPHQRPAHRSPL